MLDAFWHTNAQPSSRIHQAAFQYGPYAVIALVAVAMELALVIAVSIHRAMVVGWLAVLFEAVVLLSLWWAMVRNRAVRRQTN